MHVRLDIEAAHLEDLEGWQAYDGDGDSAGIDAAAADSQLLELLQRHSFYFTQHCDMSVSDVHFPRDEQKFAVNMKLQLAAAFAHKVHDAASYEHATADQFGDKTVRVERSGNRLRSVADAPRPVRVRFKRQNDGSAADGSHVVHFDEDESVDALFDGGVVHSYQRWQVHEFPGRQTRDEMAADAERAMNMRAAEMDSGEAFDDTVHTDARDEPDERYAAAAAGVEIYGHANTEAKLVRQRAHRLRAADPQRVASFAHFARVAHGDAVQFTSRPLSDGLAHLLDANDVGGASADAELASRLYTASDDGELSTEELMALFADPADGHAAWRLLLHRARVALGGADGDGDELLRSLRAALDSALPQSAASAEGDADIDAALGADALADDGDEPIALPPDAVLHLISLLGEVGGARAEALLLRAALRSPDQSPVRHQALLALSGVRGLSEPTVAALERRVRECACDDTLCVQLALALGSAANELHHAGEAQRAHDARELLFVQLAAQRATPECATVFAIALNNSMHHVSADDDTLRDVELGKWFDRDADGVAARDLLYAAAADVAAIDAYDESNATAAAGGARKRSEAPSAPLSLQNILGGKTGSSGWKKWYEGWSVSSRKNEYLPGGGIDQSGQNWGLPRDVPGEPQYGLNGLDKNGKARSKGFLERCQGTYKDGAPCNTKHYDVWAPRRPDKGFKKKIGSGKFYAMVEAALHKRADGFKQKRLFYFELDFLPARSFRRR